MKKLVIGLCLLLTNSFTQAALITYNDYTLDTGTNIVSGGGLEWLQWDVTRGQSIGDALTTYASQGWGIASNTHMAGLFNAFGFGASTPWDNNENTSQIQATPWNAGDDINSDPIEQFLALFGISFLYGGDPSYSDDHFDMTGAHFGLDSDADGKTNIALLNTDYILAVDAGLERDGHARLLSDTANLNMFGPLDYYGVALVRTIAPVNDVPAPSSYLLLALGIVGLAMRRRQLR
jgi:hypothetical protein